MDEVTMVIPVSESFNLETAVCNHGFFMMAPNKWIPCQKSLVRPLSLLNTTVYVSITQPYNQSFIQVALNINPNLFSSQHRQSIRSQVARMLRISVEDEKMVQAFHKLHPLAMKSGFARLFRNPTLFEDLVKSTLLCNCSWARSLEMAQGLCDLQFKIYGNKGWHKRKHNAGDEKGCWWRTYVCKGNFPSSKEIASLDEETLTKHCKLGYRASIILQLAKNIENGNLKLDDFEAPIATAESRHKLVTDRLRNISGFGAFTVANILMCLGFYQLIPIDTETTKHLLQFHGIGKEELNCKKRKIEVVAEIYDKYTPFQCLAYWMERIEYYEKHVGKLSDLPHTKYRNVTSTHLMCK